VIGPDHSVGWPAVADLLVPSVYRYIYRFNDHFKHESLFVNLDKVSIGEYMELNSRTDGQRLCIDSG